MNEKIPWVQDWLDRSIEESNNNLPPEAFMPSNDFPNPSPIYLHGRLLREEMDKPNLGQEPLIEELIYKDTITMFTARPGVGKSVVTTNLAATCSKGLKAFGFLHCERALKVSYVQLEGSRDEQISRLKMMEDVLGKLNLHNLTWHTPDFNVEDNKTWVDLWMELDDAKKHMEGLDVIIFDPIYAMTTKGLTNEVTCLAIKKFLDTVKYRYHVAVIVNNHSPKDTYANDGKKIKKKDPFGVTWLSANLDGSYYIDRGEDRNTLVIEKTKSRAGSLIETLTLSFDIASFTLSTIANESSTPARAKITKVLEEFFKQDIFPDTITLAREAEISKRQLLRMKADKAFDNFVSFETDNKKTIWRPKILGQKKAKKEPKK